MPSLDMPLQDFGQAVTRIFQEEFAAVREWLPEEEVREISERAKADVMANYEQTYKEFGRRVLGEAAEESLKMIRERCRETVAGIIAYAASLKVTAQPSPPSRSSNE